ncbi:MAG: nucleoside hydrolase [Chlamydiales bacterium]|nr:nucleoside hydrolase [Chlamydiales bacterium]
MSSLANLPNTTVPYTTYWPQIHSQKSLQLVHNTDAVQDDFAARVFLEAHTIPLQTLFQGKKLNIIASVANVGFVSTSQAVVNMQKISTLTTNTQIPLFSGEVNITNPIIPPNYYGKDGFEGVSGFNNTAKPVESTPGYVMMANLILQATQKFPVTLLITSPASELAKTFEMILETAPNFDFAGKLEAVYIRGGCLYPDATNIYGCNAPYNVPDSAKDSEINFYSDPEAIAYVTKVLQEHEIPLILLPLGTTQSVLWTKANVKELQQINNAVALQLAKVLDIVPYPDARRYPADTYALHDLLAALAVTRPDLFDAMKIAITSIGDHGQFLVNETATDEQKLVYLLSIPDEKQAAFFESIIPELKKFTCFLDPKLDICNPGMPLETILEIAIPSGVGAIGLLILVAFIIHRRRTATLRNQVGELGEVVDETTKLLATVTGTFLEDETGTPVTFDQDPEYISIPGKNYKIARNGDHYLTHDGQKVTKKPDSDDKAIK